MASTSRRSWAAAAPVSAEPLDPAARTALLTAEIQRQVRAGWQVVAQTPTTAQLTRKGSANGLITLILLLCAILPGILYALLARPTETLYVAVDEYGAISRTTGTSG